MLLNYIKDKLSTPADQVFGCKINVSIEKVVSVLAIWLLLNSLIVLKGHNVVCNTTGKVCQCDNRPNSIESILQVAYQWIWYNSRNVCQCEISEPNPNESDLNHKQKTTRKVFQCVTSKPNSIKIKLMIWSHYNIVARCNISELISISLTVTDICRHFHQLIGQFLCDLSMF